VGDHEVRGELAGIAQDVEVVRDYQLERCGVR
jgi:hypothetical protein